MKGIFRDPLLQFTVLGGLLFGLDHWRNPAADEAISVPAGLSPAQLEQRVQSEILLREARRRSLDQGDSIIERQLQQKMRVLIESQASLQTPDDATLERWFDDHAERYAAPPRVDVEQVFYPRSAYSAQKPPPLTADLAGLQQDLPIGAPIIAQQNISHAELRKRYGKALADAVFAANAQWAGPIQSGLGWHLIRVTAQHAPPAADFATLREKVTMDWREAERERRLSEELQRLSTQYRVEIAGS